MSAKNLTKISLKKEMLKRFLILSRRLTTAEEMSNSSVAVTGHTHRRVGQKATVCIPAKIQVTKVYIHLSRRLPHQENQKNTYQTYHT
jgi:hypothetical protein